MGFPTANLIPDAAIRPTPGIYAAVASGPGIRAAAEVHVGPIPTFHVTAPKVEAHLLDFQGELLGTRLRLEFRTRLRGVVTFGNVEDLKRQIATDVQATRDALGELEGSR
jgi:riboflavin kinase/FMN adenylyltransferase